MLPLPKAKLPNRAIDVIKLIVYQATLPVNVAYDYVRYAFYSASSLFWRDADKLRGMLIKDCHRLEKGLALPQPRTGYGQKVAERLLGNLKTFLRLYGQDPTVDLCLTVLDAYVSFQGERGVALFELRAKLNRIRGSIHETADDSHAGGVLFLTRSEVLASSNIDIRAFVNSRHSIRQYTGNAVSEHSIWAALLAAQKTPSVCNRQAWRVHIYSSPSYCGEILALQNGNSGFGDLASHVAIITVDIRYFEGPGERSQAFVDGGLFAMSLVYALHAEGVATCLLNWSQPLLRDIKMHKVAKIPPNEVIITLLAIGEIPEQFSVARSVRRSVSEIVTWHG